MSLIVESGSGNPASESYISVADANSYHNLRGNSTWLTITAPEAEEALRRATDYMQQVYSGLWQGWKTTDTQALDWPRQWVIKSDVVLANYYDNDVIPQEIKNACAELAWKAAQGDLAPDLSQSVKREKIDVLEVEYSEFSPQSKRYRAIDNMLSKFLIQAPNGIFRRVAR